MGVTKYLYEVVYEDIKDKIMSGEFVLGTKLPSEIDLMDIYDVSRSTIRQALSRLKSEGLVRQVKGTGTFVNHVKTAYQLSNMASFSEIVTSQNGQPNSIIISSKLITRPDGLENKFDATEKEVYKVERLRRSDDVILCYEIAYVSKNLCPNLDQLVTPNSSLFDLYENYYKLQLDEGLYHLEAINASDDIAKILDIPKKSAVLLMHAHITTNNNYPLYYVEAYYVGSRYTFTTNLQR